jgi:subtilisin family serine protease
MPEFEGSKPTSSGPRREFTPESLDKTVIAIPLLARLKEESEQATRAGKDYVPKPWAVVIDVNLEHPGGREAAMAAARKLIEDAIQSAGEDPGGQSIHEAKSRLSHQYLFARLKGDVIKEIVRRNDCLGRPIFRIWPDFEIRPLINKSISTVKADAARVSFSAFGKDIVWAVLDSGIQADHPHFAQYDNVLQTGPLEPRDFTDENAPLRDGLGHGTHVAGIIAGQLNSVNGTPVHAVTRYRDEEGKVVRELVTVSGMAGMAPQCKLLSLKVLDGEGKGEASNLIAALHYIQELNGYGRRLVVHGVNMSVGYSFEPEWFACGQSPLCVEVEQLVRSGVVVVVAAGNTGYGYNETEFSGPTAAGLGVTINDPGNADLAITVGSTHRDMPHVYGVSYFSSKGPTGDGRSKPDLVAPGEKILSAAAGATRKTAAENVDGDPDYVEDSGTSMAAPHVSGVVAGFLSVRREFIGKPDRVKDIFLSTATDLKRDRHFQGHGLVDMMRAIQSV